MNVLMFASDDLRPELGCTSDDTTMGRHCTIHTPNIDKLAEKSVVMRRSYTQESICGPTRASLLTGRRPDTTRVHTIGPYWRKVGGNFTSLPEHFRNNGYFTAGMGKIFHPGTSSGGTSVDNPGPYEPWVRGDDYPYAWTLHDKDLPPYFHAPNLLMYQCSAQSGYNTSCPPGGFYHRITPSYATVNVTVEENTPPPDYQIADQAIKTLSVMASRFNSPDFLPFFVAVGFHLPHLPFIIPERFSKMYENCTKLPDNSYAPWYMPDIAWSGNGELLGQYSDMRALNESGKINTTLPDKDVVALRQHYYGAVSYMDSQLGRVMEELNNSVLADNTIVLLWGDHGYQLGEHGIWGKITNFELGTHTALIIHIPGYTPYHSTAFVEFVDIFPTLADMAGIEVPPLCPVSSSTVSLCTEGISLRPLFEKVNATVKTASFSQYPRTGHAIRQNCTLSFTGRWINSHNEAFVLTVTNNSNNIAIAKPYPANSYFTSANGKIVNDKMFTLRVEGPQNGLPATMTGTLSEDYCTIAWSCNNTQTLSNTDLPPFSGQWIPWSRTGGGEQSNFMGYTMLTRVDDIEYRYTEWPLFDGNVPIWNVSAGVELYNHSADAEENVNIALYSSNSNLVTSLSKMLRAGWRFAH
eukprot:m.121798 g.121798  ORF g.121798 m.121798 type:complete len:637 (+) comp14408_c0_seq1:78-1988(+)